MLPQLITIVFISILFGILGSISSWHKNFLLGHILSHSLLLPPSLCSLLNIYEDSYVLLVSIIFAVLFAMCFIIISKIIFFDHDIVLLVISLICTAFALLISSKNSGNFNISSYLIGDILLVENCYIYFLVALTALSVFYYVFFNKIILIYAINPDISFLVTKYSENIIHIGIILYSISITLSIKMIGTILISGTSAIPSAIARMFSKSPTQMIIIAIMISIFGNMLGLTIAMLCNFPLSPVVVIIYAILTILGIGYKFIKDKISNHAKFSSTLDQYYHH